MTHFLHEWISVLNETVQWMTKGAFTLGSIAWSEPEFVCSPSPCPHWTVFILFYFGPNRGSFASSSQQLFTPLLSNDGAEEGGKMHKIAICTFIYLRFEPFVLFTKLRYITALTSAIGMYCKCSKECWMRTEMKPTAFFLQRVSHARQESEWNTQTHFYQIIRH